MIVVISATPSPRAVLPDEVNKLVTVSLFDVVLPDTARFLETEAVPVIVVISATPSPREVLPDEVNELVTVNLFVEVLPDTARLVPTVTRPLADNRPVTMARFVAAPRTVLPVARRTLLATTVFAYKRELLIANWLKRSNDIFEFVLQLLNVFVNAMFAILAICILFKQNLN